MVYFLLIFSVAISAIAQSYVKSNYEKYRKVATLRNMSGAQVAQHILDLNNLNKVVVQVSKGGLLSDHYDPKANTVNLSKEVYQGTSIASVAVAAHEVGHAIQYATGYHGIKLRNILLKPTIIASQFSQIVLIVGIMASNIMLQIGIVLLFITVLFQVITLPIEFDASNRALKILKGNQMLNPGEYEGAKKMLTSAALTYVAAALGAVANLLYYVMLSNNRSRRR